MSDKSHILIIDDEKNYLLVLQTLLEDEGYTVTATSDPETALAFLGESEVDVVVTDMKMPRISGREVLQCVRQRGHRFGSCKLCCPRQLCFCQLCAGYCPHRRCQG